MKGPGVNMFVFIKGLFIPGKKKVFGNCLKGPKPSAVLFNSRTLLHHPPYPASFHLRSQKWFLPFSSKVVSGVLGQVQI